MQPIPLVAALALALSTPAAFGQEREQPAERASTLDTMIVTGTRVADRTVAESTSPIDIITPEALQATGTTELATARVCVSGVKPRPCNRRPARARAS